MKEFIRRLFADSPAFFNRLKVFGGSLFGAGGAVAAIPGIPEILKHYSGYMITAGAVIVAVSQLTCKNPDDVCDKPKYPGINTRV